MQKNVWDEINQAFKAMEEMRIKKEREAKERDNPLAIKIYGEKKIKKKKPQSDFEKSHKNWIKKKKLLLSLKLNHLKGTAEECNAELLELTKDITESFFKTNNPIHSQYFAENKKSMELFFSDMLEEIRHSHYDISNKQGKIEAIKFDYAIKISYLKECYKKGSFENISLDAPNWKRIGTAFFERFEITPKEKQFVSLLISGYTPFALALPKKQELLECPKQQKSLPPD